jgi:hypothetical protein
VGPCTKILARDIRCACQYTAKMDLLAIDYAALEKALVGGLAKLPANVTEMSTFRTGRLVPRQLPRSH